MGTFRPWAISIVGLFACIPAQGTAPEATTMTRMPMASEPFAGLPALSGDGRTIALPTFYAGDSGQERFVAFVGLGDTEKASSTVNIPAAATDSFFDNFNAVLTEHKYAALSWTLTPDDPPLPMDILISGTKLSFSGDPHSQLTVDVISDGQRVGRDVYSVAGENENSPEHVVAVGATVIWQEEHGFAYVRYDINRGSARDSDWRVVALQRAKPATPATPAAPAPAQPAPAPAATPHASAERARAWTRS
jgi:hypothetical protein